ncbi:hypothetical protein KPNJ1_01877 [Klebsiella pneumoniae 30660/NJST258_1]|uniref:Uncharacterized protein n=2 Tax=Klebsiella pneumoniae TaxID=573 RepID=A0A023JM08_KLEPN|nr:hypothetical protein [Klebsiella pneumoniae subsp. pneumoniae]AHM78621.1 hypothetical protein KPNJ2_01841 [Klebsiella pneumoniae 30684/NJST258_2]AHM84283.1 hypothetical protein KPNJ1_01877 [Klebsiella pneumoniae 30660/NJST258_1]
MFDDHSVFNMFPESTLCDIECMYNILLSYCKI